MVLKKLINGEKKYNNYLYFSFYKDEFDVDIITNELGLEPTSVMIKREPVPKSTSWKYRINAGSKIDLETYLEKLLDVFEPKVEIINQLKVKLGLQTKLQFVINLDINPDSSTPYFGLNERAVNFLYMTKTTVDFDVYKADISGLIINSSKQLSQKP